MLKEMLLMSITRYVFVKMYLLLNKNVSCGYLLKAPCIGASNEYPQNMFSWRKKSGPSCSKLTMLLVNVSLKL